MSRKNSKKKGHFQKYFTLEILFSLEVFDSLKFLPLREKHIFEGILYVVMRKKREIVQ